MLLISAPQLLKAWRTWWEWLPTQITQQTSVHCAIYTSGNLGRAFNHWTHKKWQLLEHSDWLFDHHGPLFFQPYFVLFNSLTTIGYLLEVFIRLWKPSLVRISTSAWSQHRNLSQSFTDTFSAGSWPLPHQLINDHSIVRALWPENAFPG